VDGLSTPLDERPNLTFLKVRAKIVATVGLKLVILEHVEVIRICARRRWEDERLDIAEGLVVRGRNAPAMRDDPIVLTKLMVEYRGLEVVEPRIEAPALDLSIFIAAVVAKQSHLARDLVVIRHDGTAVAEATEDLCRIETDPCRQAERSCESSAILRSQSLCSIFDHEKVVTAGDVEDRIHGTRAAIQVHGKQGARSRRDRSLYGIGID